MIFLKTKEEIKNFIKVGKITAKIISQLKGETTNQLNNLVIELCKEYNVKPAFLGYNNFPSAICASTNNILVHGIPNDDPILDNLVSIDLGIDYNGYIGDTAVTFSTNPKYQDVISQCKLALKSGISQAKPKNKLSDIAKAINSCRGRYSIPNNYGGHGIDRYRLHAKPFVANTPDHIDFDITLRPNMIIAIEPMLIDGSPNTTIALDNWSVIADGPAVHFEHTILITDNDPVILTEAE